MTETVAVELPTAALSDILWACRDRIDVLEDRIASTVSDEDREAYANERDALSQAIECLSRHA